MDERSTAELPSATEVVVIGGGIAGVTTAWYLAAAGVPFALFEKGRIAGEQSSRNWGWIRKQGRDPRELPLMVLAERLWTEIAAELPEDVGFRRAGVTYLIEDDADARRFENWLDHARLLQLDTRLLSKSETDALLPGNCVPHRGSLHTPSDHRAEPGRAVPAMARALRARGAAIHEGCAVRGIDVAAGAVTCVVTERGRVRARAVVVAGGVWSRLLLRPLGVALPQLHVLASVQRTTPAPLVTESAVGSRKVAFRRRTDGGYTLARTGASRHRLSPASLRHMRAYLPVLKDRWRELKFRVGADFFQALADERQELDAPGPFERTRVLEPAPDHRLLDDVLASARRYYPQLEAVQSAERWAGAIDVLPDEIPALGPVPGVRGLLLATGFSGHGFGIGPGAGFVMAQLARGLEPAVAIDALALDRFGADRGIVSHAAT